VTAPADLPDGEQRIVAPKLGASQKEACMLKVGDQAPDFTAKDHTGKLVRLKDFLGKTLVMWFFPRADTPG
jgi:peroxiredoxin Q/BCP